MNTNDRIGLHRESQERRRILVRAANWVGDAIMMTPALHSIRLNFPSARITLLAKPWVMPVFENSPDVDERMVYQAGTRHRGWQGIWRLAGDMRRQRFDTVILFQNAFEAALLAFTARIPHRIGFTTDGRGLLLTERVRTWRPLKKGHLIDYYLGLLAGAGMRIFDRRLRLVITPAEERAASRYLTDVGFKAAATIIGFNPGATFGTAKRWLPDRYVRLGQRMIAELGARILIFGGPDETDLGTRLAAEIGPGAFNLCGQTTLRQAMALIAQCRLFITNDSGLMHVAAALDVPQVAVFGPTDPVATGPSSDASRLVHLPEACEFSPCLKPHCPIVDQRCMTAVSEELVMQAALEMLARFNGVKSVG